MAELSQKHDAARVYLLSQEKTLRALTEECKGDEPDIQDIRQRLADIGKQLSKDAMSEFSKHSLRITRLVQGVERDLKMKDRSEGAESDEKAKHPFTICF